MRTVVVPSPRARVIISCYLSPQSLAHVQHAFPPPHCVGNAGTWDALVSDVQRRRCDVAIVDPCAGGDQLAHGRLSVLASALGTGASIPVVGYLSVTAGAMRAVQALVRLGSPEIVIRGVDDSFDALAAVIRRAVTACASVRVVCAVEAQLQTLPLPVAAAIRTAFNHPEQLRSVTDLAIAARVTRRSLDRWLARAGLSPARIVLSCARVNAAFHLLAGGKVRLAEAAMLLGYASSRSLTRELSEITGCAASSLLRLSPDAFAATIGRRLLRRHQGATVARSPY